MAGGRVCLGQIGAAHGVRGEVRLRSFTAESDSDRHLRPARNRGWTCVRDRNAAAGQRSFRRNAVRRRRPQRRRALVNVKLYVPRERLPQPKEVDEFYHADLIGLAVVDRGGRQIGTVVAVHNFGAGDLIEVRQADGAPTQLLPFDAATVPEIDVAAGRMVVEPPAGRD